MGRHPHAARCKSQASVGFRPLFCGGKDLEDASLHRGCSIGSIGREPQSLISLQATTCFAWNPPGVECSCVWLLQPPGSSRILGGSC